MKTKAFTLIELLVVIVIIGILATIATSTFKGTIKEAKNTKILSASRNIIERVKHLHVYSGEDYKDIMNIPTCTGSGNHRCIPSDPTQTGSCGWAGSFAIIDPVVLDKLKTMGEIPEIPSVSTNEGFVLICNSHYGARPRLEWFLEGVNEDCVMDNTGANGGRNTHPSWGGTGTLCNYWFE